MPQKVTLGNLPYPSGNPNSFNTCGLLNNVNRDPSPANS